MRRDDTGRDRGKRQMEGDRSGGRENRKGISSEGTKRKNGREKEEEEKEEKEDGLRGRQGR